MCAPCELLVPACTGRGCSVGPPLSSSAFGHCGGTWRGGGTLSPTWCSGKTCGFGEQSNKNQHAAASAMRGASTQRGMWKGPSKRSQALRGGKSQNSGTFGKPCSSSLWNASTSLGRQADKVAFMTTCTPTPTTPAPPQGRSGANEQ